MDDRMLSTTTGTLDGAVVCSSGHAGMIGRPFIGVLALGMIKVGITNGTKWFEPAANDISIRPRSLIAWGPLLVRSPDRGWSWMITDGPESAIYPFPALIFRDPGLCLVQEPF